MALKPFIRRALEGQHLDIASAREAMGIVMRGEATPAQIAAWLVALRLKRESVEEIVGFATAMREEMVTLEDVPTLAIDTCGTGGDELGTFNISTAAGLIVAACGVPVAKHGNRAVSSQSGSADVLAALGFDIDPGPATVSHSLNTTGFGFMFAPRFHPAMKHAALPRKEIGIRTVFNMLGPLCNPARVGRQVVGIFDRARVRQVAEVLRALGSERALVVSGPSGADELLPCGENVVAEWDGSRVIEYTLDSATLGMRQCVPDDLRGGDAAQNASILRDIAAGKDGPRADSATLNAGAALYVAGQASTIARGVEMARDAIVRGELARVIDRAAAASHESTVGKQD